MTAYTTDNLPGNLFQLLFEKSPGSVLLKADPPCFTIMAVSDDFLKINSVSREEVLGKGFFEAFPENKKGLHGKTTAYQGFMNVVKTCEKVYIPFLRYDVLNHETNTFTPQYWRCSNNPILGADNKVVYILKTIIDITGEVNAQHARAESESRLLLAAEATGLAIWDLDLTNNGFSFTPQLNGLFGHKPETRLNLKKVRSQIHPDDMHNIVMRAYQESLTTGDYLYEVRVLWPDDSLHWIKTQGKVLFNENNEPVRMLGTIVDITESKRDEIRKNDFIAMASHELKTPLTSLKAYLQLLETKLNGVTDPFIKTAVVKSGNQVNKMTALIHSFLDISKLEPGKLQLKIQNFDINKLIGESVTESRAVSSTHHLMFKHSGHIHVDADREKTGQVISNFISNAIKYSPKGSEICLHSEVADGQVQVSVKDEGMGIKLKDQEKIFQRFYRADEEDMKNVSGFGIGLYLSSEITQRHKGKIWVKSEEGRGSIFYFSLPLGLA
jgi:two-component system, OmpR family, sensor histidine kinase VicK